MKVLTDADALRSGIADRSVRVVDARTADEYRTGHIPTALNLPVSSIVDEQNAETAARLAGSLGISNDGTLMVIYDGYFGTAAALLAWRLEYAGYQNVSLLECSYVDWLEQGLESDYAVPDIVPVGYSVKANPSMMATIQDVESSSSSKILVDSRRRLDFLARHIPGAVSIPYRAVSSPGSVLRGKDELLHLFANRGIGAESNVITYDDNLGALSALAYYALKHVGLGRVRLYLASFAEWRSRKMPIETQENATYGDLAA